MLERAKELFDEKTRRMRTLTLKRFPVLGAYELALKCSHVFNLLDARGAIIGDRARRRDGADSDAGDRRGEGLCGAGSGAVSR